MAPQTPDPNKLERQKAAVIRFLYWFILIAGTFCFAKYLLPVFMPFVIAYLLAWALNRPTRWLCRKTHLPRGVAALVLILLFTVSGTGLLTLVGTALVAGIRNVVTFMPELFSNGILPAIEYFFSRIEGLAAFVDPVAGKALAASMDSFYQLLSEGVVQLGGAILSSLGSMLTHVPSGLMKTLVTLIASVFIATDFDAIRSFISRLLPDSVTHLAQECGKFFGRTLPKCLLSYLALFVITCFELTIGLLILRVPSAPIVALVIALLDILPVLGTGTVLIPWALISLLRQDFFLAIGLLVLYVIIAVIRNALEPRLVGKQIQLHPVLTFMGMLVGLRFFGFFGMLGMPLLLAFLRYLHEEGVIQLPILSRNAAGQPADEAGPDTEPPQ